MRRYTIFAFFIINFFSFSFASNNFKTPLYEAAEKGDTETAKALLEYNADVHNGYESNGVTWTPLSIAAEKGHTETVGTLLEYNADVNKGYREPDGSTLTPLHIAAENGHTETAKTLLEYNADVNNGIINYSNGSTWTPLHKAIENGHERVGQVLLWYGADPQKCKEKKENALQCLSSFLEKIPKNNKGEELKFFSNSSLYIPVQSCTKQELKELEKSSSGGIASLAKLALIADLRNPSPQAKSR